MKSIKIKDQKYRIKFGKSEIKNYIIKYLHVQYSNPLCKKYKLGNSDKYHNFFYKNLWNFSVSKTKIVRRCIFNNRGRGSMRNFGISRILFREYLNQGIIPGFQKAIW